MSKCKKCVLVSCILALLCVSFIVSSCVVNHSSKLEIRYSERQYRLVFSADGEACKYVPEPQSVTEVMAKVVETKRPLVDSISISHEETKTLFAVLHGQEVPTKKDISNIKLWHWTYFIGEPLKVGETVKILFDGNGNLVDISR